MPGRQSVSDVRLEPPGLVAPRPCTKPATPRRTSTEFYVIEITNWRWSFSFSVNRTSFLPGAYYDARHLIITGNILRPKSVKANTAELTVLPDPELLFDKWPEAPPKAVAQLQIQKGVLDAVLSIPADALAPLLVAMCAERIKFVTLEASLLQHGQASIKGFHIDPDYDETNLPAEVSIRPRR